MPKLPSRWVRGEVRVAEGLLVSAKRNKTSRKYSRLLLQADRRIGESPPLRIESLAHRFCCCLRSFKVAAHHDVFERQYRRVQRRVTGPAHPADARECTALVGGKRRGRPSTELGRNRRALSGLCRPH
jgi:hypothetical protein